MLSRWEESEEGRKVEVRQLERLQVRLWPVEVFGGFY